MSELKLGVSTPERVHVELPIAGIGTRALAYLVDVGLLSGVGLVLYFVYSLLGPSVLDVYEGLGRAAKLGALVGLFFVLWVYWTALEVLWNGQTVGKRLLKVRVVQRDGSPVGAFESAVRNLLRLVDFFPVCYPVGVVTMLLDPQHRRVGDLVAGTLLIREEAIDLSRYAQVSAAQGATLSAADVELVTGYLRRFETLDAEARLELGRQLAARLGVPADEVATLDAAGLKARLVERVGGAARG